MNLESVIGSRAKVSLLRFLSKNKDWQFNLSEISKSINADKGALSRLIRELEKKKIVETRRNGKLLLFKLNLQNKLVRIIIPMFEREARI
jgi:DNA-binding MarR family transcriptional regulator